MSGIWVGLGTAALGAYSANRSASAANKKKTTWTDQTTTQTPHMADQMAPDFNEVLNYQRGLVQRGVPVIGKHGNITYEALPVGVRPGGDAPPPAGGTTPGGGGKLTPINSPSSDRRGGRGRGGGGGSGSGDKRLITGTPTAAPTSAGDIFREAAERGFAAGDSETVKQGRAAMGNILGAAGGGGPESSGFEGYNPILDRLSRTLEGDVGSRQGKDLLMKFLAGNPSGGGTAGFAGGGGAGGASSAAAQARQAKTLAAENRTIPPSGSRPSRAQEAATAAATYGYNSKEAAAVRAGASLADVAPQPAGGEGSAGDPATMAAAAQVDPPPSSGPVHGRVAGANDVPDTMAVQSFFNDETRKLMDEKANEEELAGLISAMNADTEKGMFRDMAQLDAAAAGAGRFGGDMWKGMSADAREEALQEMLKTSSGVRMGDREARRQARLSALQGVNQRDLGLLGANVQREGIAAGERASANAAAAGAAGMEAQMELARRGQDLSAIGALMDSEQFSLGQLGDVGSQLSGDRLNTLGLIPGLEGVNLGGINAALGGGQGLNDITGMANQLKLGQGALGVQRQGLNQQAAMWNAGQSQNLVNNYMGTLMNLGSMGGTSRTTGTNVQPGLGVSPSGAAAQGALGGFLAGYGATR